eukprot:CAMPEP_0180441672 /NCGR_PEP_ID=MMETSP1036_2-20121128/13747_1 /TAXON_ID=632150 /ORGANISM="Azadinium spinosum, Strain 3D9" /LENGTH=66 /DNA_ID=CAMNT_0022447895 /DNA_START=508 /DNA_END=708 /DNA_ORIENTATION=+
MRELCREIVLGAITGGAISSAGIALGCGGMSGTSPPLASPALRGPMPIDGSEWALTSSVGHSWSSG